MTLRVLHSSDWHLGQHFMGKTRQAEHQAFCAWLLEQVRVHEVDVLLIAGDVFDTGAPPSYAREQYYRLVVELRDAGCALVVLGGNHDSPAMLGESRSLLAQLGTQVVPGVGVDLADQVLVLKDRADQPGAILCAIPFIRPRDVLASQAGQSAQDKQQSLQQAIAEHYRALHELALRKREELGQALPIIATGHLTTVGASASESVREIYVGSLEAFPTSAFPQPTTLPSGISTARRRSAAWSISATAARPLPCPSMKHASRRKCCCWSSALLPCNRSRHCPYRCSNPWPACAARSRNWPMPSPRWPSRAHPNGPYGWKCK